MTDPALKILLIEDDQRFSELTARYLESHGNAVERASTGAAGELEILRRNYDCVILDIMLPDGSGVDVCRRLRARTDVPIIMLTALAEDPDVVLGLESGADEYVAKPISGRALLARIRATVRRARGQAGPSKTRIVVGALEIDPLAMTIYHRARLLDLTTFEFTILRVLAEHSGRVLSREQLLDLVKGNADLAFDRSIDGHISRLRAKLGDDARQPRILKTVRNVGYLLVAEL